MTPSLKVKIGKLILKNPVMAASGTFGDGREFEDFLDLDSLGAIITKTITLRPRRGNVPPRTCETPSGMLNSIGLQNGGLDDFIKEKLPRLKKLKTKVIVSVSFDVPQEGAEIFQRLDKAGIDGFELNLSCPNVKRKGFLGLKAETLIAQDAPWTKIFVSTARKATDKVLIAKLSPNVTDIVEIAKAAEAAGADAVSLVNTFPGMSIDTASRRPKLGNITGGLSGPAIKPIALRMVWQTASELKIPVIGIGGIAAAEDALEFIIAGARAVQVGTANFLNPCAARDIIDALTKYLKKNKIERIKDLTGSVNRLTR